MRSRGSCRDTFGTNIAATKPARSRTSFNRPPNSALARRMPWSARRKTQQRPCLRNPRGALAQFSSHPSGEESERMPPLRVPMCDLSVDSGPSRHCQTEQESSRPQRCISLMHVVSNQVLVLLDNESAAYTRRVVRWELEVFYPPSLHASEVLHSSKCHLCEEKDVSPTSRHTRDSLE